MVKPTVVKLGNFLLLFLLRVAFHAFCYVAFSAFYCLSLFLTLLRFPFEPVDVYVICFCCVLDAFAVVTASAVLLCRFVAFILLL